MNTTKEIQRDERERLAHRVGFETYERLQADGDWDLPMWEAIETASEAIEIATGLGYERSKRLARASLRAWQRVG